jgi:hypothetical protein
MRGRSNRKGPNPLTRSYESNGPDVKIRGTAQHVAEKPTARDAQSSGDTIMAESLLQHAEHYFRLIAAAQQQQQVNGYGRPQLEAEIDTSEDDDDFAPLPDRFAPLAERLPPPSFQPPPPFAPQPQPLFSAAAPALPQPFEERPIGGYPPASGASGTPAAANDRRSTETATLRAATVVTRDMSAAALALPAAPRASAAERARDGASYCHRASGAPPFRARRRRNLLERENAPREHGRSRLSSQLTPAPAPADGWRCRRRTGR